MVFFGPGRGGIARYCVVLACPGWGPEGAVLRGIALSGFADLRDWHLWRALGNCARGGGIARYCVVLPCPGWGPKGAVLRGIAWYCPVPGGARKGRYWAYCVVLAFSGYGTNRRYWAVVFGIGIFLVSFRVVLAFFGGGRSGEGVGGALNPKPYPEP